MQFLRKICYEDPSTPIFTIAIFFTYFWVPIVLTFIQIINYGPEFWYVHSGLIDIFMSKKHILLYVILWVSFQFVLALLPDYLHRIIPIYKGHIQQGPVSPGGNVYNYNINGLQAFLLTHLLFWCIICYDSSYGSVIADNWYDIYCAAIIIGNAVAFFTYIKSRWFSKSNDKKYTGNCIRDFYSGIELHPRIAGFDLKLFFNGRPGIIGWSIIDLSFTFAQYHKFGYVTNSIIIVDLLHLIYIVDFFWNEKWYLHTIDIAYDHFGWYLSFGDCVWLPFFYTSQTIYLSQHDIQLSKPYSIFVLLLGISGYLLFRFANRLKDRRRLQKNYGKEGIDYITAKYVTADNKTHENILICSGIWGFVKHPNYIGDLIFSSSIGLASGFQSIIPHLYSIYMFLLLSHRCIRDDIKCSKKYGKFWEQYSKKVKWYIIPYVF